MRKSVNELIISLFFLFSLPLAALAVDMKVEKLEIRSALGKTHAFQVEIADTLEKQEQGLKHRTSMEAGRGMLFLFPEDTYVEMWMKDTPIPLDILFLDGHGKVVYIAKKTVPDSTDIISAKREVRATLELTAGEADKLGIAVGDRVVYPYFKP